MSNPDVSISSFFQVFAIPRRNLQQDFPRELSLVHAMDNARNLYDGLVLNSPNKDLFGQVGFVICDRLFDARIALKLDTSKQIEDVLISNMQNSWPFTSQLLKNEVNVFQVGEMIRAGSVDYFDLEDPFLLHMDHYAHYFVLPVYVICTSSAVNAANALLDQLKRGSPYKQVTLDMTKPLIHKQIKQLTLEDRYFVGLMENEELAADFIRKAKGFVSKLLTPKLR